MAKLTDRWLQKRFDEINCQYYDGRIPFVKVSFGKTDKDANGHYDCSTRTITINDEERRSGNERHIAIELLHESVHADLDLTDGYIGRMKDPKHGTRFHAGIWRLLTLGAYDGVLIVLLSVGALGGFTQWVIH